MADALTALRERVDIVLLDCPPVLPVTDALVLSGKADATLLVCYAGTTTQKQLTRAVELLHQVDAPIVGTVLTGVSTDDSYGYAYQYYRYAPRQAAPASVNGKRKGRKGAQARA
jgi:Mrp family chromosome partitioning ATPase